MGPKYTIRKAEGKHLVYENRIHLAREWNRRIKANDAKLSFRSFARMMHIPEASWRREYYAGGGTDPVPDLKIPNRRYYGEYDPDLAQRVAGEKAAQKGPRQKLLKPVADSIVELVKDKSRHRSLYEARILVAQAHPEWVVPCLRTLYYHVEAGDIGLSYADLVYGRRHRRKKDPAHPAKTVQGRRKLEDLPPEAAKPSEAGHLQCDTVVSCAAGSGGVFVLYDRVSRKYWLEFVPAIDQASILAAIARLRSSRRIRTIKSIVSDNGCEFLNQVALDKAFGAPVYYTRAYASYEKGGVENCNRILRRWFPKGTDFSKVSAKQLRKVEGYINDMHRPSLDGLTAEQKARELCHVA